MGEWQTIDTAPLDGTQVLIYDPSYETEIACAIYNKTYGWVERGHDYATDVWGAGEMSPTHWMPLPEKP